MGSSGSPAEIDAGGGERIAEGGQLLVVGLVPARDVLGQRHDQRHVHQLIVHRAEEIVPVLDGRGDPDMQCLGLALEFPRHRGPFLAEERAQR